MLQFASLMPFEISIHHFTDCNIGQQSQSIKCFCFAHTFDLWLCLRYFVLLWKVKIVGCKMKIVCNISITKLGSQEKMSRRKLLKFFQRKMLYSTVKRKQTTIVNEISYRNDKPEKKCSSPKWVYDNLLKRFSSWKYHQRTSASTFSDLKWSLIYFQVNKVHFWEKQSTIFSSLLRRVFIRDNFRNTSKDIGSDLSEKYFLINLSPKKHNIMLRDSLSQMLQILCHCCHM